MQRGKRGTRQRPPKKLHWRGADIVYWRYSTTSGYRLLREACLVCRRPVGRWTYLGSETGREFWEWPGKIGQNSGERWLRVIEGCTKDEEVQTASDGKSLVYKSQSHQAKKKSRAFNFQIAWVVICCLLCGAVLIEKRILQSPA